MIKLIRRRIKEKKKNEECVRVVEGDGIEGIGKWGICIKWIKIKKVGIEEDIIEELDKEGGSNVVKREGFGRDDLKKELKKVKKWGCEKKLKSILMKGENLRRIVRVVEKKKFKKMLKRKLNKEEEIGEELGLKIKRERERKLGGE